MRNEHLTNYDGGGEISYNSLKLSWDHPCLVETWE